MQLNPDEAKYLTIIVAGEWKEAREFALERKIPYKWWNINIPFIGEHPRLIVLVGTYYRHPKWGEFYKLMKCTVSTDGRIITQEEYDLEHK